MRKSRVWPTFRLLLAGLLLLTFATTALSQDGSPGDDGEDLGPLSFQVTPDAPVAYELLVIGNHGGEGGDGSPGADGDPPSTPTANGNPGEPGGNGGPGGEGGSGTIDVTVSTDVESLSFSVAGGNGGDGGNGAAGGNGGNSGAGPSPQLTAGNGGNGGDGGEGGNGATGPELDVVVDSNVQGDILIANKGGDGGDGGNGASGGNGGDTPAGGDLGGDAGDGGDAGFGGNGGDGGDVDLTVNGQVGANIIVASSGGDGGATGNGGNGGEGGDNPSQLIFDGEGGNGGDGVVPGEGGTGFPNGVNGNEITDPPTTNGGGGDIAITINNSVGGSVKASTSGGDVTVTLNDGATVGGSIDGGGGDDPEDSGTSTLIFNLQTEDEAEFEAAAATLGLQGSSGSIIVNGQTYTWANFDALVDNLYLIIREAEARGEAVDIVINVDPPPSCAPAGTALFVNGSITVIRYDGGPGLTLSAAEAAAVPVPTEQHTLVATSADGTISLYRLTTGEWQINVGPAGDGLTYTCVWTGTNSAQGLHTSSF